MCFLPTEKMLSRSFVQKLQCIMQRQSSSSSKPVLRDLSQAEFDHYVNVRTACVHYVKVPHVYFGTKPDTFAAALNILDVFLWKVKVTEKHMSIVAMACFLIAAKMLEEEEVCPSAKQLSAPHEWTSNDLCRMELHILKKLGWCVTPVSYLDFLPLFAEVYGVNLNLVCCDPVTTLAERCLSKHSTVLMQPAVLALSLLHHVTSGVLQNPAEPQLLVHCNIQESDLQQCKANLSYLSSSSYSSPPSSPTRLKFPRKIFDKPSVMGITDLPTIIEEPYA